MNDSRMFGTADALAALADIVYARPDYDSVYAALCRTAVDVVPGCDHACISTLTAGGALTAHGATDEVASQIDRFESELRDGPCYDAITTRAFQIDADLTRDPTWPELSRLVLAHTPVRGMIGYRVLVGPRKAGSLNLFSDTPGAFDARAADLGAMVAAFASVALGAAAHHERAETLHAGLHSNREIGQATGILMATHGVSDEAAFAMLRETSQELNLKLVEVVRDLLDGRTVGDLRLDERFSDA